MSSYTVKNAFGEIYNVAGKTNIGALAISLVGVLFIFIREYDLRTEDIITLSENVRAYKEHSITIWFFVFFSAIYAFAVPVFRTRKTPYGKYITTIAVACSILALALIVVSIPSRLESPKEGALLTLAPMIGPILALLLLFIQLQVTSHARRTNHSMQALLQMRMSEVYQRHISKVTESYPGRKKSVISASDVEMFHSADPNTLTEEDSAKIEAIFSQIYVLNYFEFLAYGVKAFTMDEELLYGTLASIILQNWKRSKNLIAHVRHNNPKCYENLHELIEKWQVRHEFDESAIRRQLGDGKEKNV